MQPAWQNISTIPSRSYVCGHCGNPLASNQGYYTRVSSSSEPQSFAYICHHCNKPTYFNEDYSEQVPGVAFGEPVNHIPSQEIASLYNEARNCLRVGAYTASVLCSRKLLMNIAVEKGAKEGLGFTDYVDYLEKNNYTPPDSRDWVDHIRKQGNQATHRIAIMSRENAEELIVFVGMLLKFVYEFPEMMKMKAAIQGTP